MRSVTSSSLIYGLLTAVVLLSGTIVFLTVKPLSAKRTEMPPESFSDEAYRKKMKEYDAIDKEHEVRKEAQGKEIIALGITTALKANEHMSIYIKKNVAAQKSSIDASRLTRDTSINTALIIRQQTPLSKETLRDIQISALACGISDNRKQMILDADKMLQTRSAFSEESDKIALGLDIVTIATVIAEEYPGQVLNNSDEIQACGIKLMTTFPIKPE